MKMLDKAKKAAMNHAMKLMSHPQVAKLMSDPRVMNALSKGFEIHGQVRSRVEETVKFLAQRFNLTSKD
jgi:hypothetical protein